MLVISASGVLFAQEPCLLHPKAIGKQVFGPRTAMNKPEVERSVIGQPAKSASA